jgi:TldD protein
MTEINRRDFVKNVGFGMGMAISSNIWLDSLFAGVLPDPGKAGGEGFFGVSQEEMRKLLGIALSKGGNFSELFFEYRVSSSVAMEEDILKNTSESIQIGVGVRVLNGEQRTA